MTTKDLFSSHASQYAAFRPDYPKALYDFIFSHVQDFSTAWDCATGNGQAAKELASRFNKVYATDISDKQMANGFQSENIFYSVSPAEQTSFANGMFNLITVAQAAHWLNLDQFYREVNRVARPGCVVAIWGYGLLSVNLRFDAQLLAFYKDIVGPYWDPERKLIDSAYQTIPFPFHEIQSPAFSFTKRWHVDHLEGYLNTWSAVQKYIKAKGNNPVENLIKENGNAFGAGAQEVKFPLFLRLGLV